VSEKDIFARAFDRTNERASFYASLVGKEERFQNTFQNKSSRINHQTAGVSKKS